MAGGRGRRGSGRERVRPLHLEEHAEARLRPPGARGGPEALVHLGVDDATFLSRLREVLAPGGLAVIYNLSPPQNPPDKPWIPWADGRCPFTRGQIEKAGFEVLVHDEDDGPAAREMARRLEWDNSGMDPEKDLFGHVTVFRKPRAS